MSIVKPALSYFALTYAAGFVFGSMREALLVPHIGPLWATVAEVPLMLIAVVAAAVVTLRVFAMPSDRALRLRMGLLAFAILLVAEIALSAALRGWSPAQWFAHFIFTPEGHLSLVMFLLFAFMPMLLGSKFSGTGAV